MKLIKKAGNGLQFDVDGNVPGGSGGGVEFNSLTVTVTFSGYNHMFTGVITSEIPENTVINDIIKIENVFEQGSGLDNVTTYQPLPMLNGRSDLDNNLIFTGIEVYGKLNPAPEGMTIPLGIMFTKVDVNTDLTTFTETFKITYV